MGRVRAIILVFCGAWLFAALPIAMGMLDIWLDDGVFEAQGRVLSGLVVGTVVATFWGGLVIRGLSPLMAVCAWLVLVAPFVATALYASAQFDRNHPILLFAEVLISAVWFGFNACLGIGLSKEAADA